MKIFAYRISAIPATKLWLLLLIGFAGWLIIYGFWVISQVLWMHAEARALMH